MNDLYEADHLSFQLQYNIIEHFLKMYHIAFSFSLYDLSFASSLSYLLDVSYNFLLDVCSPEIVHSGLARLFPAKGEVVFINVVKVMDLYFSYYCKAFVLIIV